ncbi:MAG: hypothetical protein ACW99U_12455 [Candidatus Thorarchaeota archaeon]|jgi:hypothetical protein
MKSQLYDLIDSAYRSSGDDLTPLFEVVKRISTDVGLWVALSYLEDCVIRKRQEWLDRHLSNLPRSSSPLEDGFRIFYQTYLGLSIPKDGEIIDATETRIQTRWWNECPVPVACKKTGLDTRVVCRHVYHESVQQFLFAINEGLVFERNYQRIRPYSSFCEEAIVLTSADTIGEGQS